MLERCGGRGGTTPSTPSVVDVTAIFTATRPTDAQSDSSAVVSHKEEEGSDECPDLCESQPGSKKKSDKYRRALVLNFARSNPNRVNVQVLGVILSVFAALAYVLGYNFAII